MVNVESITRSAIISKLSKMGLTCDRNCREMCTNDSCWLMRNSNNRLTASGPVQLVVQVISQIDCNLSTYNYYADDSRLVKLFRYGLWGVNTCVRWNSLSWVELIVVGRFYRMTKISDFCMMHDGQFLLGDKIRNGTRFNFGEKTVQFYWSCAAFGVG